VRFFGGDHGLPVLFVTPEAFPLAKTGGLADVCGALPAALRDLGVDLRLMLPGYPQALDAAIDKHIIADLPDLCRGGTCRLIGGRAPRSDIPIILFDCPALFRRDGGLYQNDSGADWSDNHRRFALFCRAAAAVAMGEAGLPWRPALVHANDWHTGLIPAFLHFRGTARPRTVFTIHNLAFQGNFPLELFPTLGLPEAALSSDGLEFYGQISFLKAGLRYSDRLTTVSPNYAREILSPEHGCGLDGLLRSRTGDLVGILNGIDYSVWNPAIDAALPHAYDADDLSGKDACKAALCAEMGLTPDPAAPLLIYVNRLTNQKMADVVLEGLSRVVGVGAQVIVHGRGEHGLEQGFSQLARHHHGRMKVELGYREDLAHRLNAGADLSLTPSRFEPCGLTTMYAMCYGALPVSRAVGGVSDTVQDADVSASRETHGTGFLFEAANVRALERCIDRALAWYRDKDRWQRLQRSAMKRDFRWERSARRYLALYAETLGAEFDRFPPIGGTVTAPRPMRGDPFGRPRAEFIDAAEETTA
jgi:starch synthase